MKKVFALLAISAFAVAFVSCGQKSESSAEETAAPATEQPVVEQPVADSVAVPADTTATAQ